MVCGDITDGVAAGLNRVHIQIRQCRQNVWRIHEFRPVKLNILPRREVAVPPIPALCNIGKPSHLVRR